jgi:hypothetical protein
MSVIYSDHIIRQWLLLRILFFSADDGLETPCAVRHAGEGASHYNKHRLCHWLLLHTHAFQVMSGWNPPALYAMLGEGAKRTLS